jgi:DNA-directed RNA polymerase subunit RPC12/RpoP
MKRLLLLLVCLFLLSPGVFKSVLPKVDAAEQSETSSVTLLQSTEKNWLCHKCSTKVSATSRPNSSNCPEGGQHHWNNLGEVGDVVFLCDKCSVKVKSKSRPNSSNCPSGGQHRWNRLTN